MATVPPWTRRDFMTRGAAVGALRLPAQAAEALAQASPTPSSLPETPRTAFPALNRRAMGWLRFLWEKSTTADDWASNGVPHPWWDRYTAPVVLSYGRFDLSYSAYGLLMLADQTPAWREVYTKITDGLARRYPTYWGAIDWLTQIGNDPKRAKYPASVMATLPPERRGTYDRFGWTANGIEPWGLQKDPVGADGYLFFRGWLHLLLATYRYIAGDDAWTRPFTVVGYGDETFEWDHHRLAARLEAQYRERPEGPHCENTKVWFYCNSAAALGMYLYDRVHGRTTHRAAENFLDYSRRHYVGVSADGKLEWVTAYYDPQIQWKFNTPPAGGLLTAFLLLPQHREFATFLYESAVNAAGWRTPNAQIRANPNGLLLARELGDSLVAERLAAAAERENEPRFFGRQNEMFGWFFNLNEAYPRGQQSATMMVSEIGRPGDWARAFQTPHLDKFTAPTVEGVDFPSLGVYQAWNDPASGTLRVGTYAAAPDRRGRDTAWRVTNLPNAKVVTITADGQPFTRFEVIGPATIRIDSTIDLREFVIVTGHRGGNAKPDARVVGDEPQRAASEAAVRLDAGGLALTPTTFGSGGPERPIAVGCPCCP